MTGRRKIQKIFNIFIHNKNENYGGKQYSIILIYLNFQGVNGIPLLIISLNHKLVSIKCQIFNKNMEMVNWKTFFTSCSIRSAWILSLFARLITSFNFRTLHCCGNSFSSSKNSSYSCMNNSVTSLLYKIKTIIIEYLSWWSSII